MNVTEQAIVQVREIVAPLTSTDRLRVIEAIVTLPTERVSPARIDAPAAPKDQDLLQIEQTAWFAQSAELRLQFRGEFVAVHKQKVVDHDPDKRSLYIRVRQRFGPIPVLILSADLDEPPTFRIYSPRLEKLDGPNTQTDVLIRRPQRL